MSRLTPTTDGGPHARAATTLALRSLLHELRNILTPVSALAQVAHQHPHDKQIVALALRNAVQGCEDAVQGAHRILDIFAHVDEEEATGPVSVLAVVEQAIQVRQQLLPDRIYSVSLEGQDCVVDGVILRLVLTNLLLNAEAASPTSGAIRVLIRSTWNTVDGSPRPADDQMASIEVVDHGTGFDTSAARTMGQLSKSDNKLDRSLSDVRVPSGLGLMISRKLLHACGGRLEIKSKPGQGTIATILLPAKARERSRAA